MIHQKIITLFKDELWWGGCSQEGLTMPFGRTRHRHDLRNNNLENQAAPLLISNRGRYVWSEEPFRYQFASGQLKLVGNAPCRLRRAKGSLREAYLDACQRHFPPTGKTPPRPFFVAPQLNTWIELNYHPTQQAVMDYARAAIKNGFPPGVIMLDDGWQRSNGDWDFRLEAYPDPKGMMKELKKLGFKVMVWMIHCVSPDTEAYRYLTKVGGLACDARGEPVLRKWWNGVSAQLDLTSPAAQDWLNARFKYLRKTYGIGGFKLDGGDFHFFAGNKKTARPATPQDQSKLWAEVGLRHHYNEYRGCWKMGAQPLVQRLWDRTHSWDHNGLAALIPNSIAQSMLGHAFICPDMVGGGMLASFQENIDSLDQELVVRMAQCSALMPMMQFSAAPWRILDRDHMDVCREAVDLHTKLAARIWRLAKHAATTGEPILRPLAYEFPASGMDEIKDQFMLGSDLLAAPVLHKAATTRRVVLPPGTWTAPDGSRHQGPATIEIPVNLHAIPYFTRTSKPQ